MIDAYTIGITLALNNGVAEGIAAIRRDLAALDRAVDASAAGLMQLRAAAGGSIGAASADLARLIGIRSPCCGRVPKPSLGRHPEEPPLGSPPNEKNPEAQEFQPRSRQPLAPASPGESRLPAVPKVVPARASSDERGSPAERLSCKPTGRAAQQVPRRRGPEGKRFAPSYLAHPGQPASGIRPSQRLAAAPAP